MRSSKTCNIYVGNKGHFTLDSVLTSEVCLLQSRLSQYLSILDLNHLSNHCPILLKLSSINPNSAHLLKIQTGY